MTDLIRKSTHVPDNPEALALMRLDRARMPQYLTREQISELVAACRNWRHGRDRLFARVAFETGARVSELIQIRRSDIDITNRQIRLTTLKRRVDRRRKIEKASRWMPVSASLCADLAAYFIALNDSCKYLPGEDYRLFAISRQAAYNLITAAAFRAGLVARGGRRVSPHILRHSFAMNCLTQGVPLPVLKDLLGHASITSTLIYLKTDPAQARAFLSKVQF